MPFYLYQWAYKDPAIQAMLETPQDRPAELRKAVQAFGGNLHQFFFAFGEHDGIAIVEFPDNESCAACSITLAGAGATTALRTTVLLAASEAQEAMHRARTARSGYRAPVGYTSHG
jgi:uncharacterized protein with GYD domain